MNKLNTEQRMATRAQIVDAAAKEGGVSGYASSLKLICYPEIFFQRVLREKDVPLFSMVTTLGTASVRVTNERFLAGLKTELIAKNMVKQEDEVQAEFSYLDFKHTQFENLLKQESILGKGGFTLTVAAGLQFLTMTFETASRFDREFYVNVHMNIKKEHAPPRSLWLGIETISTAPVDAVRKLLIEHIVQKFVLLKK